MAKEQALPVIHLKDYRPLNHRIEEVELEFELDPQQTLVHSQLRVGGGHRGPLTLQGEDLILLSLARSGVLLKEEDYTLTSTELILHEVASGDLIEISVQIDPEANHRCEGLYLSQGMFCTQNEAEGFRRITYYIDRPDNLARFRTLIKASRRDYPQLLSNGNLIDQGELPDGRHFAHWEDPYPKPCYLFALVAGDLFCLRDHFRTRGGREVNLELYVRPGDQHKGGHALASLKKAMAWDEERFGLEYDLDTYMVVAVSDFNNGAMENKGLNLFNAQLVLASPETATDHDYYQIEAVIGHEYFHNWTGNRITCRDWFQLTLKEGLTVFRDQEFSADLHDRAVKRIDDVQTLRETQFPEDQGPLSHPIRPESYVEVNNFYSATVYEKGAEVIRMIHTLLGEEAFQKGMRLYVQRFDGQAVTCEDFVGAMEEASGVDLQQFRHWYAQAGTPHVEVQADFKDGVFTLILRQKIPQDPGASPLVIPLNCGFYHPQGGLVAGMPRQLQLVEREQRWEWPLRERPLLSLAQGFSAPVVLDYPLSAEEQLALLRVEDDPFNRWERVQLYYQLWMEQFQGESSRLQQQPEFLCQLADLLEGPASDSFKSYLLQLPSFEHLVQHYGVIPVEHLVAGREACELWLAQNLYPLIQEQYQKLAALEGSYRFEAQAMGQRRLQNQLLGLLVYCEGSQVALQQFKKMSHMTGMVGALQALAHYPDEAFQEAMQRFYRRFQGDDVVLNKWFALQMMSPVHGTLEKLKELEGHPRFNPRNPNNLRALYGAFMHNFPAFHQARGEAYHYLAQVIARIDRENPSRASRLAAGFNLFERLDGARRSSMEEALGALLKTRGLSKNTTETVGRILG